MARKKSSEEQPIYRVTFHNQGHVYEIYARHVGQGEMFGFVEVEHLLFGARSQLIVDSSEERLKTEFAGVKRVFVPLHAVIRIDEVEKQGSGKISTPEGGAGKVSVFPVPVPPPANKS